MVQQVQLSEDVFGLASWASYVLSSWTQMSVLGKHWTWTYSCIMDVKGRMRVCSVGPSGLEAFLSASSDAFAAKGHFMG